MAEAQVAVYDAANLFPVGSAHHAAEVGSLEELAQAEAQGKERGYPSLVTLQSQDDILQCMPLHVAAEKGRLNVVQYLISHKVDLDAGDGHMVRPLHLAAITNHVDVVRLLLDKGANPTKQDNEGDIPLLWAATKGHVEMMELLLDRGSAVDAPNREGWTALHRAAYTGHGAACRLLLRRGASLNAVTRSGRTPLHLAALQNQLGVMDLLLDMGAGTHFRDNQGASAGDLCISDAARELIQEKAAARGGSSKGPAPAAPGSRRPVSSTSAVAPQAGIAHVSISHVPEMPRYKPAHNANLDADGFPVAIQGQMEDLQASSSTDLAGTELLVVAEQLAGGAEQLEGEGQISALHTGRPSLLSYQAPVPQQQQQPGQLSASNSFGRSSAVSAADALLAPQQKPAGPNKKFLEHYNLHRMGLFAP